MPTLAGKLGYAADVRQLFRDDDITAMKNRIDLSSYSDVYAKADKILKRLKKGDMPCDGAWPPEKIGIFAQWISDGKLP